MNNYIKRTIEKRIISLAVQFPVVALTGPRQTGKTTTLKHIFGKTHKYVSLDNTSDRRLASNEPELFLDRAGDKAIIDEIQYAPELLSHIKIRADNDPDRKGVYILTGSQQFLLMKGFSETLAGRIGLAGMLPLSLNEIPDSTGKNSSDYLNACVKGGYPRLYTDKAIILNDWYETYLNTYVERDVKSLYNVGNTGEFDAMLRILASRTGQLLNMSSLASDTGVAVNTVKRWLSILEASNIIYFLRPYHRNLRTRMVKSPKVYFTDTGLVCYLNGISGIDMLLKSHLAGFLFENFCIMETVKWFKNNGINRELSFFRTAKGVEIDLLISDAEGLIPVEIKSSRKNTGNFAAIKAAAGFMQGTAMLGGYIVNLSDEIYEAGHGNIVAGLMQYLDAIGKRIK